ncbi:hypothetical protein J7I98_06460 [Streptomyces sp. ISL-98]|uniref:hypothetical protein n=1 Tax=Streptomyces sp. ISL-98 TaxID=2819192 RepID=UPI001BE9F778|nr:hypothetical protein [Streptomyces sp. ISL-98]MBT2505549.1 hypothetical protein [Streptomyces sp. ISL-98]
MSAPSGKTPPELGDLVHDSGMGKVGEFRGAWAGKWLIRPVLGGTEWDAEPENVRPADQTERLSARTAQANARSAGALL